MTAAGIQGALREFTWPRLWLGIWALGWVLCIALSLLAPVQIDVAIENSDKIGHFLAYGTLSAWAVLIFARRKSQAWAALALALLGGLLELAQGAFTQDRLMDPMDAVANALGVLLGQCLAMTPMQTWLQRVERRFRSDG